MHVNYSLANQATSLSWLHTSNTCMPNGPSRVGGTAVEGGSWQYAIMPPERSFNLACIHE